MVGYKTFENLSEVDSFLRAIELINKTPKKVLNDNSPLQILKRGFIECPIKRLSNNEIENFSYKRNKEKINKKMEKSLKFLPILHPVRFSTAATKMKRGENFMKKSIVPAWSPKTYFVFQAKRK